MFKKNFSNNGYVKIISGKWKGKKIKVIDIPELRPTKNQIRETLFNWLNPVLKKSKCLDCFAGSGALSLEALSRGALYSYLIEKNKLIYLQLKKNLHTLNSSKLIKVINHNSLIWLSKFRNISFNIVFIDPPFFKGQVDKTIHLLEKNQYLCDESWIYTEQETKKLNIDIPKNWKLFKEKISKNITYRLFLRKN